MKRITKLLLLLFISASISAQVAPNFTITDTDNNTIDLYTDLLDNGKTVVLKLFFVACPLCKPYNVPFQELYEEMGEGNEDVEFLLLTTQSWDSNSEVADYRVEYGLSYPGSGNDGGGYAATAPYRNGDFGSFFGAPSFIIIAPDKTVYFDPGGGGTDATMQRVRAKIIEIKEGGTNTTETSMININVSDYKNGSLPDYKLFLRSGDDPSQQFEVPLQFEYPSENYPVLSNPELYISINETNIQNVTTFDLFTIQKHILGQELLDNFQVLAADVNASESITAADLLSMRKVILNIQDGFTSDKSYLSINSQCAEDSSKCETLVKIDPSLETQDVNFTVIKVGDVK